MYNTIFTPQKPSEQFTINTLFQTEQQKQFDAISKLKDIRNNIPNLNKSQDSKSIETEIQNIVSVEEKTQLVRKFVARLKKIDSSFNTGEYLDLTGVDLSGLDLTKIDFRSFNLTNANLSESDLTGCNFCNTNLTGANLKDAILGENIVNDCTKMPDGKTPNATNLLNQYNGKMYL
jgi:uncharacterized protein YjbI with pentapeptide repeats